MLQIPMDPDDAVKGERDGHDTALMVALSTVHADTGCFEVARLLLEAGARVDVRSRIRGERTPLMVAARTGQTLLVRLLLDAGAGVDLRDSRGYTALMHAAGSGFEDVVMLLLEAAAEKNWLDLGGQTALDLATGKGHEEVRQLLLKAGARSGSIMRFQEPWAYLEILKKNSFLGTLIPKKQLKLSFPSSVFRSLRHPGTRDCAAMAAVAWVAPSQRQAARGARVSYTWKPPEPWKRTEPQSWGSETLLLLLSPSKAR